MAEKFKAEGNSLFKQGKYAEAVHSYTLAIESDPSNPVLYSNRAMAHIRLEKWHDVVRDCAEGLHSSEKDSSQHTSTRVKLLWRKGVALLALGDRISARAQFHEALKLEPGNKAVLESLNGMGPETLKEKKERRDKRTVKPVNTSTSGIESGVKDLAIEQTNGEKERNPPAISTPNGNIEKLEYSLSELESGKITSDFNLYSFMQLQRSSKARLPFAYHHLFTLAPSRFKGLFGKGGIDNENLEFIVDAIVFMRTNVTDIPVKEWRQKTLEIMQALTQCARFDIAIVFADTKKINHLASLIQEIELPTQDETHILKKWGIR